MNDSEMSPPEKQTQPMAQSEATIKKCELALGTARLNKWI